MTADPAALPIREDLAEAIERAWRRLAAPAIWWDGVWRLAIVAETRHARVCALSASRPLADVGAAKRQT